MDGGLSYMRRFFVVDRPEEQEMYAEVTSFGMFLPMEQISTIAAHFRFPICLLVNRINRISYSPFDHVRFISHSLLDLCLHLHVSSKHKFMRKQTGDRLVVLAKIRQHIEIWNFRISGNSEILYKI